MSSVLRDQAHSIFMAAVQAAQPGAHIARELSHNTEFANAVDAAQRIIVVGGGKAGATMAAGLGAALGSHLSRTTGFVNIPDEAACPTQRILLNVARPIGRNEATPAAVEGTSQMLALVEKAGNRDIVICLLSGGGSALLPAPPLGIPLCDKVTATRLLSEAGASIDELNCVRKHLSRVKGGQLAERCCAGSIWSLIISDVVDDRLDVIASGPTAPDPTTFNDAISVLENRRLCDRLPQSVRDHLDAGLEGRVPETPKHVGPNVHNLVIANNAPALSAAREKAEQLGYGVQVFARNTGESVNVAAKFAEIIRSIRGSSSGVPVCLLIGGEMTVTMSEGHGLGGGNQEFILALGSQLGADGLEGVTALGGGTDGEDGPTDAAGAMVDLEFWLQAITLKLEPADYLKRHDSYRFFEASGGLIKTGLTGTNVADVTVILVSP